MKLPSLTKIPRHRRFEYTPRYYDPAAEELRARTEQIRREVEQERRLRQAPPTDLAERDDVDIALAKARISRTFTRRAPARQHFDSASLFQLLLVVILGITAVSYFYFDWGNGALIFLGLALVGYFVIRKRFGS